MQLNSYRPQRLLGQTPDTHTHTDTHIQYTHTDTSCTVGSAPNQMSKHEATASFVVGLFLLCAFFNIACTTLGTDILTKRERYSF